MRRLLDSENKELQIVLEKLLAQDVDITVREVARHHPKLHNASDFTRNRRRRELIEQAQQRQADARHVKISPEIRRSHSLAQTLEERDRQVAKLQAQVDALVASHAACIRAVMVHGGMDALERFWEKYKTIAAMVRSLGAVPGGAEVVRLPRRGHKIY